MQQTVAAQKNQEKSGASSDLVSSHEAVSRKVT
jgi:hypothetical protein